MGKKMTLRAALLASAAGFTLSGMAYAQEEDIIDPTEVDEDDIDVGEDAPPEYLDTIVVTGFRASVERSLDLKRNETSIVEAISAEDIGKLPDVSIAEALARLPGLAAQRLRGRAQVLSVRGLGPDFTSTLLNGREQVTAGDNRGVEFDQYPAELLSAAVVYKTPDAQLIGQGLAGTVDLRTIRPLDYGERRIAGSARYEINDLDINSDSEDGYRFTGFYVDQFADDTFGVVLGVALQSSPTQAERFEAWGYPTVGSDVAGNPIPGDPFIIGGAKPYVEARDLERNSLIGTLEWEPNASFSTSVDAFYSQFEDGGILRGVEFPLFWGGVGLQPGSFEVENGLVTSGNFVGFPQGDGTTSPGVEGVVRNDARAREADLMSLGWNMQFTPAESWLIETDISFSSVDRDDVDLESYTGTGAGRGNGAVADVFGFAYTGDYFQFSSPLDYSDPSQFLLTDPQGWGQVGFIKRPNTEDELLQLRASVEKEFDSDFFDSLVVGVNNTSREKSLRSEEAFIDLAGGASAVPVPADLLQEPASLDFLGIGDVIAYDPFGVLNSGLYSLRPNVNPDVVTKAYDVTEDVLTLYTQLNINGTVGNMPLRGNVGAQYVRTDQESTGARVGDGVLVQVTEGDDYSHFLPSLNLNLEIADRQFLRFGAARVLARPRMDQLRASQQLGARNEVLNFPGVPASIAIDPSAGITFLNESGGNPQLRPYVADQIDVSYEWYFAPGGSFAVAGFYKWLDDFVYSGATELIDLSTLISEFTFQDGGGNAVSTADIIALNPEIGAAIRTQPTNGEGGYLRGFEASVNFPLREFIDGPLGGFGFIGSFSYTESEVQPQDEPNPIPIPGLSEKVANATVYYEYKGFEARVSNRYRSDFLGEVTGFGAGREFRQVQSESIVDAQIGYRFQSGPAEGVSLILQANNLTDEEFVTLVDNPNTRLVRDYQRYGTTYLFGVGFDF